MTKYDYISKTFCETTGLDARMTLDELVTFVARRTTLTGVEVAQRIIGIVNLMLEQYKPSTKE